MKVVFCVCLSTIITLVNSAPTIIESLDPTPQEVDYNQRLEYLRGRRSNQYAVVSPCNAAAASMPTYPSAPYGYAGHGYAPYANNYAYPNYAPVHSGRVYRADDVEEPDVMSFSDSDVMDHVPWARYSYGGVPAVPQPVHYEAQTGLAYGVFPNAHTGGCGIPLLVSCSPNVVQGKLVKAEQHSYGGTPASGQANGYRLNDHQDTNLNHHNPMVNDHSSVTSEGYHDVKTQ